MWSDQRLWKSWFLRTPLVSNVTTFVLGGEARNSRNVPHAYHQCRVRMIHHSPHLTMNICPNFLCLSLCMSRTPRCAYWFYPIRKCIIITSRALTNDIFCTMESIMIQEMHEIMQRADNMVLMTCDDYWPPMSVLYWSEMLTMNLMHFKANK